MSNSYYVYALCRPDGTPFYVGKGKGSRINDHGRNRGRHKLVNDEIFAIEAAGGRCLRVILHDRLSEEDAYSLERKVIRSIGRSPDGPLVNRNDGGFGGKNPAPEVREKIREARKRQASPSSEHMEKMRKAKRSTVSQETREALSLANKGKVLSPETRQKISEKAKLRPRPTCEEMDRVRSAWDGTFSPEAIEKIRKANLGRKRTEEQKLRMGAWQVGRRNSEESNRKRSAALSGRKKTPEHLAAIRAAKLKKSASKESIL